MAPDGCTTGLPPDLAAQLQPLLQALSDATGESPPCASAQPDTSAQAQPSEHQRDLQLIAETLALLAMADPGYGYPAPGYGSPGPGYGYPPPAKPAVVPAPPATPAPAEQPVDVPAADPVAPPGTVADDAACAPTPAKPASGGENP